MKMISTTVKKIYFIGIKNHTKNHEYKVPSDFWKKRLEPLMRCYDTVVANFLCGREYHKRYVEFIQYINVPWKINIDGNIRNDYFDIYLGDDYEIDVGYYI